MKLLTLRVTHGARHLMMLFAAALFLFGIASAAAAKGAKTEMVHPGDVQAGTYRIVTYEHAVLNDPVNIAILQKEGTPYDINFADSRFRNDLASGMQADQALSVARNFVESDPSVQNVDLTKIYAPDGTVIGYEMTPVFMPLRYGGLDPFVTNYKVAGNSVLGYVTEDPMLMSTEQGGG